MRRFFPIILILILMLPLPAGAQDDAKGAPPSRQALMKALQWMQSSNSERRQAAYRSVHLLGKEAMPAFRKALQKALQYHERRLAETLSSRNRGGNPYSELESVAEELKTERARVYPLMMRDWKKNKSEIDQLRAEFGKLDDLFQRASKLASSDTTKLDEQIQQIVAALVEIHDQLARFEGQTNEEAAGISDDQRKNDALKESFDGHSYLKAAKALGEMRSEISQLQSANEHNAASSWASGPQKSFARLISYERAVLGLSPLRLEEKLSSSAVGHSRDMKSLGFFSHTSPVPGKASFTDRGYGNAVAAYGGWFYSDGHRHIMLGRGPNILGIGPVGSHWTLVTGRQ
jgi:uncharacterized protein YkwD